MLLRNLEGTLRRSFGPAERPPQVRTEVVGPGVASGDPHRAVPTDLHMPPVPRDILSSACVAQDRVPVTHRVSEDMEHWVHASALVNLCPRQYALAWRHGADVTRSPSGADRIMWHIGLAVERHVVAQVAAHYGTDVVRAGYELRDPEHRIVGRPDMLLRLGTGSDVHLVTEVKSMNLRDWNALEAPLADHVLQAALYRWMFDRNPMLHQGNVAVGNRSARAHDRVALIYAAKDWVRRREGPYKEFHVDTQNSTVLGMVEMALGLAAELRDAADRDGLPARRLCPSQNCARARGCRVATLCFNLPAESQ